MSLDRGDVLLAQQTTQWKINNSLWIAVVVFPCGCLSIIGWIWAGYLAQSTRIWKVVAIWAGILAVWIAVIGIAASTERPDGTYAEPWDSIATITVALTWVGGIIHAGFLARPVLKYRLLHLDNVAKAVAQHRASGSSREVRPSTGTPATASDDFLGVRGSDYYAPAAKPPATPPPMSTPRRQAPAAPDAAPPDLPPPPGHWSAQPPAPATPVARIDVNSAALQDIESLPRIDAHTAQAILSARQRKGGFRDLDDLADSTGLQPHLIASLKPVLSFGPFRPTAGPSGSGRVLDV